MLINNLFFFLFCLHFVLSGVAFGIEVSYRSIYSVLFQISGKVETVCNYLVSKWIKCNESLAVQIIFANA